MANKYKQFSKVHSSENRAKAAKEWNRTLKGCRSKKRYKKKENAEKSAAIFSAKFKPQRAYYCHSCNGWHLTTQIGDTDDDK